MSDAPTLQGIEIVFSTKIVSCRNYFSLRCRQREIQVKFFFAFFSLFDRVRVADHEKQLFTLRKYLFHVENDEKVEGCHIFQKTRFVRNASYISVRAFSEFVQIFFSDSTSNTESRQVVKST
jgi:hypothetical protein